MTLIYAYILTYLCKHIHFLTDDDEDHFIWAYLTQSPCAKYYKTITVPGQNAIAKKAM